MVIGGDDHDNQQQQDNEQEDEVVPASLRSSLVFDDLLELLGRRGIVVESLQLILELFALGKCGEIPSRFFYAHNLNN